MQYCVHNLVFLTIWTLLIFKNIAVAETESSLPAMKILPVGSSLNEIRVSQFNDKHQTSYVLLSDKIVVLENQRLKGSNVDLTMYKNNLPYSRTLLSSAFYSKNNEILYSDDNLQISGELFDIAAQGLILDWKNRAGFLLGKSQSLFYLYNDKNMTQSAESKSKKQHKNIIKKFPAIVAAYSFPIQLSYEELKMVDEYAQSSNSIIEEADSKSVNHIEQMREFDTSITETRNNFYSQMVNAVGPINTIASTEKKSTPKEGKTPISVTADKGSYFDANTGIMVYQSNVKVTHPRYSLFCTDELKITLKEESDQTEIKSDKPSKSNPITEPSKLSRFNGLSKAIATGNVVIKAKNKDGKNIIAQSDIATYDSDTGIIMFKGGKPSIQHGDKLLRMLTEEGYILILPNMSFQIKGEHEVTAVIDENKNKQ